MSAILLSTILACPVTIKVNKTEHPWNDIDTRSFESAKTGCIKYYERSPCLKKFTKKDINNYHAICGHENEKSN